MSFITPIQHSIDALYKLQASCLFVITDILSNQIKQKPENGNTILAFFGGKIRTFQKFNVSHFGRHLEEGIGYTVINKGMFYIPCDEFNNPLLGLTITDSAISFKAYLCNKTKVNVSFVDLCNYSTQVEVDITHIFLPERLLETFNSNLEEYRRVTKLIATKELEMAKMQSLMIELPLSVEELTFVEEITPMTVKALNLAYEECASNMEETAYSLPNAYKRHLQVLKEQQEAEELEVLQTLHYWR